MKDETQRSKGSLWVFLGAIWVLILAGGLFLYISPGNRHQQMGLLQDQVRTLGELVTVNQIYRNVIYKEERRLLTDKRVLFSMNFHLRAGVPLEDAQVFLNDDGIPVVRLGQAQILSVDADERSIEQIFIRENFGEIHQSDYMDVIIQEKERLVEDALETGILLEAQGQAERVIIQLFSMAGFPEVQIERAGQS